MLEKAKAKSNKANNRTNQPSESARPRNAVNENAETVTLQQSNAAKIVGIVAIGASILPFTFIGVVAGVYGFNLAKKYKSYIEQNPQLYGTTITNNINLGFYLSIAGAVLGGIRLISFIF